MITNHTFSMTKGVAMLRKTITIDENLFNMLKSGGVLNRYSSFSELVSYSLKETLQNLKYNNYKKELEQMAKDPMVIEDIKKIEKEFKYADEDW